MKNQILATLAALTFGTTVLAQGEAAPVGSSPEIKADHQDLKEKREEVREKKSKLISDKKAGANPEQIASDRKDLKAAKAARRQARKKLHEDHKNVNENTKQN